MKVSCAVIEGPLSQVSGRQVELDHNGIFVEAVVSPELKVSMSPAEAKAAAVALTHYADRAQSVRDGKG